MPRGARSSSGLSTTSETKAISGPALMEGTACAGRCEPKIRTAVGPSVAMTRLGAEIAIGRAPTSERRWIKVHSPVTGSRSTAITLNPVMMRTCMRCKSCTKASDSWFMPPSIPATADPAGAALRMEPAAAAKEPRRSIASLRPGVTTSTSSLSGCTE